MWVVVVGRNGDAGGKHGDKYTTLQKFVFFGLAKPHQKKIEKILYAPPSPPISPPLYNASSPYSQKGRLLTAPPSPSKNASKSPDAPPTGICTEKIRLVT